ncbi:hypothetical protein Glove_117g173 [Diversispora epigaea]|uniref:Protein kinase domain-containing protein n=1 Tax=Diversispora epigaea TaxID=1348612 RepID=A0A397J0L8_9GLOM|nr:hypothetical protein Glove_117g173 [Diversispora epigaea]
MSRGKKNEKEWKSWLDSLIIEETIQKQNIPFYQYSEFQNVKLISKNIFKATFKISQKTVKFKCVSLNDKFTLNNLINEIKKHRKLEIHDSILKFYGITKHENTKNYMIILEYVNEESLREYLKSNFQKMDWNAKLNLAKQIANILMHLHSNDIIHGKFNSENIHVHDGNIKLNVFGLANIISDSLSFLTNNPIKYTDPRHLELFSTIGKNKSSDIFGLGIILWEISSCYPPFEIDSSLNVDLLNNIANGKREMTIPGTPHKYKEIYSDCWKYNGNLRPDISQVVKNLSEIIISDSNIESGTLQSQSYNVTDSNSKNLNIQNEKPEIKPRSSFFDATAEVNVFIKDLFELLNDLFNRQFREIRPITIKNYIIEHKKNPVEVFSKMISHPYYYWFTGLIGFFYQHGIGTVADYQMAIKFFNLASNQIIDTSSSNFSPLRKLYDSNKEISTISLANMHFDGLGFEKDTKKAFQIYHKLANKGSLVALINVAYCYENGFGVEKNEMKAFELYLKSSEKGYLAQFKVGFCYKYGTGITKDESKGFQWVMKSALSGNANAMCNVGFCYDNGIGVGRDEKQAVKWYMKAAEKELNAAQHNLGWSYKDGEGIVRDYKKAFEWFKKAAENNFADSQYMLGKFFYEGYGTKKDIVNAIYWLNKANESGNAVANELLEEIISNMMY